MTKLKHCLLAGLLSGIIAGVLATLVYQFIIDGIYWSFPDNGKYLYDAIWYAFNTSEPYRNMPRNPSLVWLARFAFFIIPSLLIGLLSGSIYSQFITKSKKYANTSRVWGKVGAVIGALIPFISWVDMALQPTWFYPHGRVPWHVHYMKVMLVTMAIGAISGHIGGRIGGRKLHSALKLMDATRP